ncbi:CocE/NonD family hydrolase [Caviibacterium pharyngocola]|uniref:Xaa-Pro dipeptidyl-peptidase-like domain-containing protein n=1 Tax=Caviibacterium pharyngocola TaxID=28159 RepID=A0A2M8RUB1_9PAST|nr:CocE/NonD family hydrolase [Caviibacterium pharyngocola]PJG82483.1 hypothetical protein CVP04_09115 [Caviibacterium pharyngocola]
MTKSVLARRQFLQGAVATGAAMALSPLAMAVTNGVPSQNINTGSGNGMLALTQEWDKTFPKSDKVDHRKVTFTNRYGITLAGDLYMPKNRSGKLAAIAFSGPFGAVKEQTSGLYAQTLAERGFITIAFDPSYVGESGGQPRGMASPDINSEDFSAALDFLGTLPEVDRERLGLFGICGFGGMSLNAASMDTRVKALATSVLYDMSRSISKGVGDQQDLYTAADRRLVKDYLAKQRWADVDSGTRAVAMHELPIINGQVVEGLTQILPENKPDDFPEMWAGFFDYYRTKRGYHPRGINSNTAWLATMPLSFFTMPMDAFTYEISVPVLIVAGEKAHSRYMSEDAFAKLTGTQNKELVIVPNATHTDLYDNVANKIPFDKFEQFFKANLK